LQATYQNPYLCRPEKWIGSSAVENHPPWRIDFQGPDERSDIGIGKNADGI